MVILCIKTETVKFWRKNIKILKTIFPPHPRQLICNAVPALMGSHSFSQFFSLHSYSWVDTVNSGWSRIIPVYIWRITANISRGLQLRYFADYTVYHKLYTVHCTLYNVQFVQFRLSERFPYFITKWKIINIFEFLWNWKGMILKLILIYYINYIHILIKSLLQLNKNI